jgi:hypothetical protein
MGINVLLVSSTPEPEFLNFYGGQGTNSARLGSLHGGPVRQTYYYSVPSPHRLFKNSSTETQLSPEHHRQADHCNFFTNVIGNKAKSL